MKKFTYFACLDGGALVELNEELALDLYKVAGMNSPEHHRNDEESDDEWLARNTARGQELLEVGTRLCIHGDSTYIFGVELSTKERFKFLLTNDIQTLEEFRGTQLK